MDPSIQQGLTTAPLATISAVLLAGVVYLFREVRALEKARIEDLQRFHAENSETQAKVIELALKSQELVDVVERVADHVERRFP